MAGGPSVRVARDPPANPVREEKWNEHKERIRELFIDQGMRLQDVMDVMRNECEFTATLAQYNTRLRIWGMKKNGKRDHQADDESRNKRPCARSEPQPAEDSAQSQGFSELSANGRTVPAFQPVAGPPAIEDTEHVTLLDNFTGYVQPTNFNIGPEVYNPSNGTQLQTSMSDAHFGPWNYMNASLANSGPLAEPLAYDPKASANLFNLSYEPSHPGYMNIITGGNAQPSQLRHLAVRSVGANQVSSILRQPIHQAAQAGNFNAVKFLLQVAPECANTKGGQDVTPLWIAAQGGHLRIVDLILEQPDIDAQASVTGSLRTPVHQAAQGGHLEVVKRLLDRGAGHDPRDDDGISPLWSAAQQGHIEIVKLLIEKGADVEVTSKDGGRKPIHQAAQNGHVEVARMLLDAKADPNPEQKSFDDETPSPFWLAAQNGNVLMGELLIKHKVNIEYANGSSKRRSIHQAVQNGHVDFVRFLIENHVQVDPREEDGWTPLMMAAQEGYVEIIKELLKAAANVNACEKDNATAIWIASQQGHIDVVKKLHEAGAKIIPIKSSKRRPLHQATQNGHLEVTKFLVNECGEDVNAQAEKKATPLLLASQGEGDVRVEIMKFLYEKGAKAIIGSNNM